MNDPQLRLVRAVLVSAATGTSTPTTALRPPREPQVRTSSDDTAARLGACLLDAGTPLSVWRNWVACVPPAGLRGLAANPDLPAALQSRLAARVTSGPTPGATCMPIPPIVGTGDPAVELAANPALTTAGARSLFAGPTSSWPSQDVTAALAANPSLAGLWEGLDKVGFDEFATAATRRLAPAARTAFDAARLVPLLVAAGPGTDARIISSALARYGQEWFDIGCRLQRSSELAAHVDATSAFWWAVVSDLGRHACSVAAHRVLQESIVAGWVGHAQVVSPTLAAEYASTLPGPSDLSLALPVFVSEAVKVLVDPDSSRQARWQAMLNPLLPAELLEPAVSSGKLGVQLEVLACPALSADQLGRLLADELVAASAQAVTAVARRPSWAALTQLRVRSGTISPGAVYALTSSRLDGCPDLSGVDAGVACALAAAGGWRLGDLLDAASTIG